MKQHLNTLFVTTQGTYLRKDGQTVDVRVEKKSRLRIPIHNLDGIVAFGRVGVSPALLGACTEANITISFLTMNGRFLASVAGYAPGNVLLRRKQYRLADDPVLATPIARSIVAGKLGNCRTVLRRAARDTDDPLRQEALNRTADRLTATIADLFRSKNLDQLRGIEGESATSYFAVMNQLIVSDAKEFEYTKRSRRPPLDPINAMLSFAYTLLMHDARSACEVAGLDAAVGFLHRDRPGRPGMALDLMEEFRPFLADRLVLSLINRQQIQPNDFVIRENGAILMSDSARKTFLTQWQQRKQEQIAHPFLNEKTTIGLLMHLQARLMARYLRGDLDEYPPFIWK